MNYAELKTHDIANGPGVRVSLFVSGCRHHCKGCFNEVAWDFDYGEPFDIEARSKVIEALLPDYIRGITFLGGEPLDPRNVDNVAMMISQIKNNPLLSNKDIWVYTGYTMDALRQFIVDGNMRYVYILKSIDVLVEGPFIEEQKNLMLRFRGSANQRIIDMKKTAECNEIILWDDKK